MNIIQMKYNNYLFHSKIIFLYNNNNNNNNN